MSKTHRYPTKRRNYSNVGEININGLNIVKNIMRKNRLNYDCDLFSVTSEIERLFKTKDRERHEIDTTFQVIRMINYIASRDLLDKNKKDGE